MTTLKTAAAIAVLLLGVLPQTTSARGACDGIHRCTCGTTQARYFGLPFVYNGVNLKQAKGWVKAFPRTTAQPGAVVYQHGGGPTGHVSRITSMIDRCTAIVTDEKGTYERNICQRGAVYVMPGHGGLNSYALSASTVKGRRSKTTEYIAPDRFSVH